MLLLGDSLAVTVGVRRREETVGALLSDVLVSELGCAVELEVLGRAGATTAAMGRQLREVIRRTDPGVVVILVGGNDVMLPAPLGRAAAQLGRYVSQLRAAGWQVVVGSCADVGACPALRRGVAAVAGWRSRRLARGQAVAVLGAGGVVVSLTTDALRAEGWYCSDNFHPSAEGYRHCARWVAAGLVEASRAFVREPFQARESDVFFGGAGEASRRVVGESGACFIPASGDRVVMRSFVSAAAPGHACVAEAPVPAGR
ncbi:SGNH/GDSL hydrolase family protein [Streptomyces sp. NPDC049949]|uniref:SGNH/GDSL hydrolase family protein n=1 Tax=Streptomyces sp. NPDC049949 TaxID=3154627 RepID=UPI00342D7109